MKIRKAHHICIQTEDYHKSLSFYVDLLGFEIIKENPGFHDRDYNTWIKASDIMIELQTPKKNTQLSKWSNLNSGPVHMAFVVDEVKAAYNFIKSKGYNDFKVKNGQELYNVKGMYIFKVHAPEGTEIEIRENLDVD